MNPAGHSISSRSVTSAFWWKAFNFFILNTDEYIIEEVKYVFRELYNWCASRGLIKGNPPDFHNRFGKMNLLSSASKFFNIPESLISFQGAGIARLSSEDVVVKSLTSGFVTSNRALFTTEVDKDGLDTSFPWFIQELIVSDSDLTTFICGQNFFTFSRSRKDLLGLDWRSEQSFEKDEDEWKLVQLESNSQAKIEAFINDISIDWGRIDFLLDHEELIFLEFNANGQWMFLDYHREHGLLDHVLHYLTKG